MTLREKHPDLHAALEEGKAVRAARKAELDKAIRRALSGDETDSKIARRMRVGIRRVQRIRRGES